MGYTTDFEGEFKLDRALAPKHANYLEAFNLTRRMKRSEVLAAELPDPIRLDAGLPIGRDGQFFVGGKRAFGQDRDSSILDYNHAPEGQPGLWCKWEPNADGTSSALGATS